jgi:hypothetical protein
MVTTLFYIIYIDNILLAKTPMISVNSASKSLDTSPAPLIACPHSCNNVPAYLLNSFNCFLFIKTLPSSGTQSPTVSLKISDS